MVCRLFSFKVFGFFFLFHDVSLGLEDGAGSPNPDLALPLISWVVWKKKLFNFLY